jgi:hypothetical protein
MKKSWVVINETLHKQLSEIAKKEKRTIKGQAEIWIEQGIEEYEELFSETTWKKSLAEHEKEFNESVKTNKEV